jgi:hypothetical protein
MIFAINFCGGEDISETSTKGNYRNFFIRFPVVIPFSGFPYHSCNSYMKLVVCHHLLPHLLFAPPSLQIGLPPFTIKSNVALSIPEKPRLFSSGNFSKSITQYSTP